MMEWVDILAEAKKFFFIMSEGVVIERLSSALNFWDTL